MWPLQDRESMNAFYGDPDTNRDGIPDRKWESENLVRFKTPYPMVLAWNDKPLQRITIHKKCYESLERILTRIGQEFTEEEIRRFQLNRFGGTYNFRMTRGGTRLSIHSWGAAIDLAPTLNPLGRTHDAASFMMPEKAVKIFESEGWIWGGKWKRPDGMHFQAARIA